MLSNGLSSFGYFLAVSVHIITIGNPSKMLVLLLAFIIGLTLLGKAIPSLGY